MKAGHNESVVSSSGKIYPVLVKASPWMQIQHSPGCHREYGNFEDRIPTPYGRAGRVRRTRSFGLSFLLAYPYEPRDPRSVSLVVIDGLFSFDPFLIVLSELVNSE